VFLYSVLAILFFFVVGRDALDGNIDFQFYADSLTYEKAYLANSFSSVFEMVSVGNNYLGPILLLDAVGGSRFLVLLVNVSILFWSIRLVGKGKDPAALGTVVFLLFLSPITFFSLISINKEIISMLAMAFMVAWVRRKKIGYVVLCLFCSLFVRWQFTIFVLLVFISFSPLNFLRYRRGWYIVILLLSLSVVYRLMLGVFAGVTDIAEIGGLQNEGTGLYTQFIRLQNQGLYFLIFVPKALHAMYGLIFKADHLLSPADFYNDVVVTLHCIAAFLVFCLVALKGRLRLNDNLVFIAVIYCAVFVLSPIYAPRYFYPVFFLLCLVLARPAPMPSLVVRRDDEAESRAPSQVS
jgi:hypothetical protein